MEDIKIWALDGLTATPLDAASQMESERKLEDTLVNNPGLLLDGLTLVGRQTPTEGGPLDLLGVDKYGRLCVFELKSGTVARDAVAQVIDYASDLDGMDLADLGSLISENSGSNGIEEIEDFEAWYVPKYGELNGLKPLRLFLVGLGVDDRTERMVNFLVGSGVDISLLTFHGFAHLGKTLLAKQVEVEGSIASERPRTARYTSRAQREAELDQRIEEYGVRDLFDLVTAMFREEWGDWARGTPRSNSLTFEMPTDEVANGWGAYANVGVGEEVWINFHRRAFLMCEDAFEQALESAGIEYQLSPQSSEAWRTAYHIQFPLTADDWDLHKGTLTALAQAVYVAWENKYGEDAD